MNLTKDNFGQRYWRWLQNVGFREDPFLLFEAEREGDDLPDLFVDRPYLHNTLGDPAHPQTALLMAGPGQGKTATREMVAHECERGALQRRALPIRYTEFGHLLDVVEDELTHLTARHHVEHLLRLLFKTLDEIPATHFDFLTDQERRLLRGMMDTFADPLRCFRLSTRLKTDEPPIQLAWEQLTARELLETVTMLITHLGPSEHLHYDALYVLVDCVDETRAGPDAAVPLLAPLVRAKPLLEMPRLAFKFFLPIKVGGQLQQQTALRPDRLYIHTVTWEKKDLVNVIQQRFTCYNRDPSKRLEDICTTSAKHTVMERLVKESKGSPRTLLRLCRALFQYHVRHTDTSLIRPSDISGAIAGFSHQLEVESRGAVPVAIEETTTRQGTANTIPEIGLYVSGGHVWLDGEQLEPPLSPQEFRLLEVLYKTAPEIVPHERLIAEVWAESAWMSDDDAAQVQDAQNLRKLISRVRDRLGYQRDGKALRFIKNVRGRGYWLDVQGEPV